MAELELFSFDKGIIIDKKSPLLLADGELVSASGFNFANSGVLATREARTAQNTTTVGSIHKLDRYVNKLLCIDGTTVRYKWDLDGYCDLYTPANGDFTTSGTLTSSKLTRIAKYDDMQFIVNGTDSKVFQNGNLYEWSIGNPETSPTATATANTGPTGVQTLYYTFKVLFPNGRIYETGLSPGGTVNASGKQIVWNNVATCPYQGTSLLVHRKLYRYSATLAEIYFIAEIADNTSTTYTEIDNNIDATIIQGTINSTNGYDAAPSNMEDVTDYLQRIFGIKDSELFWSEPYMPFAFPVSNSTIVSKDGEPLKAVVKWGDQLYMASKSTWYRLQGSSSDTWAVRNSFAEQGIINTHTVFATKYGIIGLWWDGIYLFDGSVTRNITSPKIAKSFFTDTISSLSSCFASFDGIRYRFFYPTTGTTISKHLVLDFSEYPNVKLYHDDFIASAHSFDAQSGKDYWGKTNGYEYETGVTETIETSLKTGDRAVKNLFQRKEPEYLYYDVDTNSQDLTLTLYCDGAAVSPTVTINNASRTRGRVSLPRAEGYYFSMSMSMASAQSTEIYSPWAMSFNYVGT